MHRSDNAALRLAVGLGLAALIAYGWALTAPYVVCVMAVLLLAKPGPALPLGKGLVLAVLMGVLVAAGLLMVPLLENYAAGGVLLTLQAAAALGRICPELRSTVGAGGWDMQPANNMAETNGANTRIIVFLREEGQSERDRAGFRQRPAASVR